MSAVLIPTSGGATIPLRKSRVYLGRSPGSDRSLPPDASTALCQLELHNGWWYLEDLRTPGGVRINGKTTKREKLVPHDEIEIGKHRFRIEFEAPKHEFGRSPGGGFHVIAPKPVRRDQADTLPHMPALTGTTTAASATASGGTSPAPLTASSARASVAPAAATRKSNLLGRLVPLGGGEDYPLLKRHIILGRQFDCDIVIREKTISGRHCELEFEHGFWRVKDLGSRNGTRVAGRRCEEAWVRPQVRLTVGTASFRIDYVATGDPPGDEIITSSLSGSLMSAAGISGAMVERIAARYGTEEDSQQRRWDVSEEP